MNEQPGMTVSAAAVGTGLAAIVAFLAAMHVAVMTAKFGFGHDHLLGLTRAFDLNLEANVPTWYSSAAFLLTAAAVGIVAIATRQLHAPFARHWTLLALIFVYLSLDEVSRFHEHWGALLERPLAWMRRADTVGGIFRNLWVIPAGLVALVVGLSYLRFLGHLPRKTRTIFLASGTLFVAGAVGMEMVGAHLSATGLRSSAQFAVLVTVEEVLEMGSIVLFLYGVVEYLESHVRVVEIRFARRVE